MDVEISSYELEDLVKKIRERRKIYSKFHADRFTWEVIAEIIFMYFRTGDDRKDEAIRKNFAGLWRRLSSDFVNEKHVYEYNSIKHGLRAKMGGFYFAMGAEDVPGVPAPHPRGHHVRDATGPEADRRHDGVRR